MSFYIGSIAFLAGGKVPSQMLPCDGRELDTKRYAALFDLIGTTYGGDGVSKFRLPDLRGRTPLAGDKDSAFPQGLTGGSETVALTVAEMPAHAHLLMGDAKPGSAAPNKNYISSAGKQGATDPYAVYVDNPTEVTQLGGGNVLAAGGGKPHLNMQPSAVIGFYIVVIGVRPPFN